MRAYKLFKQRKDGTIGPLFIGATQRVPIGKWLRAEDIPTKGFAHRPGWHAGREPNAPHLTSKGRVWYRVEIKDFITFKRPTNQGGEWLIANWIKVIEPLTE
jgi:hypothetical protein